MKRLTVFIVLIFTISFGCAGWSGQAKVYKTIPSDTEILQASTGLQVSAVHKKTGLYPYLSYDATPFRFGGQSGDSIDLWGLGFGIEKEVVDKLTFFCQVGWYQPEWDGNGKPLALYQSTLAEGLWIYLHQELSPPFQRINFPIYSLEYSGNIGGIVGANFALPLSDNINFNLSGAYRYLKLREKVRGMFSIENPDCWCVYKDRNFSGWQVGVAIEYHF